MEVGGVRSELGGADLIERGRTEGLKEMEQEAVWVTQSMMRLDWERKGHEGFDEGG